MFEVIKSVLIIMGVLILMVLAFPLIILAIETNIIVVYILGFIGATIYFKKCWID